MFTEFYIQSLLILSSSSGGAKGHIVGFGTDPEGHIVGLGADPKGYAY